MSRCIDLKGQHFGRLTVMERAPNDKKGNARWLCECSCEEHNQIVTLGWLLRKGVVQSCGCYMRERASEANKKYHEWRIEGDVVYGRFFNCEDEFCFSLHRLEQFKDLCFHKSGNGYVATRIDGKIVFMHQLIYPNAKMIDHQDRNKLNNTDNNLMPCTQKENSENMPLFITNTSGYKGVCWDKSREKWMAYIDHNGTRINLGRYNDISDAIRSRLKKEKEVFSNPSNEQKKLFEEWLDN